MAFSQEGRPRCGDRKSWLQRIQGWYEGHLISSIGVGMEVRSARV
ncbi:MAG: hypothetical protein R6U67_18435 [Sodalinema sp.]